MLIDAVLFFCSQYNFPCSGCCMKRLFNDGHAKRLDLSVLCRRRYTNAYRLIDWLIDWSVWDWDLLNNAWHPVQNTNIFLQSCHAITFGGNIFHISFPYSRLSFRYLTVIFEYCNFCQSFFSHENSVAASFARNPSFLSLTQRQCNLYVHFPGLHFFLIFCGLFLSHDILDDMVYSL